MKIGETHPEVAKSIHDVEVPNLGVTEKKIEKQPPGLDTVFGPVEDTVFGDANDTTFGPVDPGLVQAQAQAESQAAWEGARAGARAGADDAALARIKLTLDAAHATPADATDLDLSTRTGLSLELVQADREGVRAALQETDPSAFRTKNPALTQHLLDNPDHAPALVKDQALADSEAGARMLMDPETAQGSAAGERAYEAGHKKTGQVISDSLKVGWKEGVELALIARRQRQGIATPAELARADELEKEIEDIKKSYAEGGPMEALLTAAAEQIPRYGKTAGKWGSIGFTLGGVAGLATPGGVGVMPLAGLGASAGMLLGTQYESGQDEGSMFYRDMIKKGVDPNVAEGGALVVEAVNGLLETIPVDKVLRVSPAIKKMGGAAFTDWISRKIESQTVQAALARAATRAGEGALYEGITEALQEVAPIYEEQIALGKSSRQAAGALTDSEAWTRYWEAGKGGAMAALGTHLASPFTHIEIAQELKEAEYAKAQVNGWKAFGEAVGRSETFDKAPVAAEAWVDRLQQHGMLPETVSVPAKLLKAEVEKAGIDVESALPAVARQLQEAQGEDAEVVVSVKDLAVRVGGDAIVNLAQDIRTIDDGGNAHPTARELPEVQKKAEEIKKQAEEAQKAGDKAEPGSARYVFEGIRHRFDEVYSDESMPAHAKTQNAALWAAFVASRAERRGMTPGDYFKSKGGLGIFGDVRSFESLTKKEQKAAYTQNAEEAAQTIAQAGESPTGYVRWRPGEAPKPLETLAPEDKGGKPRKDVAPAGLRPIEDFTVIRPDPNSSPLSLEKPLLSNAPDMKALSDQAVAEGRASPVPSKTARELYPDLWNPDYIPAAPEFSWSTAITTALESKNPKLEAAVEAAKGKAVKVLPYSDLQGDPLPVKNGKRRIDPAWMLRDGSVVITPTGHAQVLEMDRSSGKLEGKYVSIADQEDIIENQTDKYTPGKPLHGFVLTDGDQSYVLAYGDTAGIRAALGPDDQITMFQKAGEAVRGFFQTNQPRSFFKITLTGKANLSTFVHETGHAFLALLESDAMQGDLTAAADLQVVRDWLGSKGKKNWTREQLETFARGFEAYMWEGKAPSTKLAQVFDAVMSWMRWIYSTMSRLNVELTPEVRGVMDRMLASDAEIAQAREQNGFMPPVDKADLAGMTPEEYQKVRNGFEAAAQAASNRATRDSIRQTRWALQDQYAVHEKQAQDEATKVPALRVRDLLDSKIRLDETLANGEYNRTKFDRDWVKRNFPGLTPEEKRRLAPLLTKVGERGVNPDLAAGLLATKGIDTYADGKALISDLIATPDKSTWIEQRADSLMSERYPGYQHSKIWEQLNAQSALHDVEIGNAIWAGFVAMSKIPKGEAKTIKMAIEEAARRRVSDMQVLELSSTSRWLKDERTAAQEVAEAWKGKNVQGAYDATRRQLMAFYTWKEATEAARRVDDIRRFLRPYQSDKKLRSRIAKGDPAALTAIDGVLGQIGFEQAPKGVLADAMAAVADLRSRNPDVVLTPEMLKLISNYKAMKLSDLESVYATVRNLAHAATDQLSEKKAQDGKAWGEYIDGIVDHLMSGPPHRGGTTNANDYGFDAAKHGLRVADASLRKIEFILREADEGATAGKLHMAIFAPIAEAEAREHTMFKQLNDEILKLRKTLSAAERYQHDQKVDFLGKTFAVRDVLAIALNLRNPENIDRLLKSEGWELPAVLTRLSEILTEKDVELINRFGQLVESYWPDISEVHTRVHGVPPKKVIGNPVRLPASANLPTGAIIEGGYYPIIKDPRRSTLVDDIRASANDLWEQGILPPVVGSEMTKERVEGAVTPMRLSLDALPHHLVRTIHYITHYEVTRQVDKIITNGKFRAAFEAKLGQEKYKELRPWLQAVVDDRESGYDALGTIENVLRHSRMGASVVLLGGKAAIAATQALGLTVTAKELGRATDGTLYPVSGRAGHYIAWGLREYLRDWGRMMKDPLHTTVYDRIISQDESFVLHRENYDRDLRSAYRQLTSVFATFGRAKHDLATFSMAFFNAVQGFVNAVTWHAALKKAQDEGHENPIAYASSVVRMSQASGGPKDLARFQRGDEFRKLMTVMFSYRNLVYNQIMEDAPAERSAPARAAIKSAQFWYVVVLPALVTAMLRADWGNDDDDLASRVAMDTGGYSLGTVPVLGDAANAALSWLDPDGKGQDAFRPSPWLRAYGDLVTAGAKTALTDHEWSDRDTEAAINALGTVGHLPTGAAMNAYHFIDRMDEMEDPGMNFFFRNKKDWR